MFDQADVTEQTKKKKKEWGGGGHKISILCRKYSHNTFVNIMHNKLVYHSILDEREEGDTPHLLSTKTKLETFLNVCLTLCADV